MFSQMSVILSMGMGISGPMSYLGGQVSLLRGPWVFPRGGMSTDPPQTWDPRRVGTHPSVPPDMGYGQQVGGTHPTGMLS